jgi:Uri superfamily endonuclease
MSSSSLPDKGAYLLMIGVSKDTSIRVGALGRIMFRKGSYVYVGSAMNSLSARISRHLRKEKKIKWHIDHLLNSRFAKVKEVLEFPSQKRFECVLSRKVRQRAVSSVPKFGCSDCKCRSHLYIM